MTGTVVKMNEHEAITRQIAREEIKEEIQPLANGLSKLEGTINKYFEGERKNLDDLKEFIGKLTDKTLEKANDFTVRPEEKVIQYVDDTLKKINRFDHKDMGQLKEYHQKDDFVGEEKKRKKTISEFIRDKLLTGLFFISAYLIITTLVKLMTNPVVNSQLLSDIFGKK